MARFWRWRGSEVEDFSDVEAPPRVRLEVSGSHVAVALVALGDPATQVDGEVLGAAVVDGSVVVTFGHGYDRRTALLRRLNALLGASVGVSDFGWLDPMTEPDERWLADAFTRWETGRHRDPNRIEPIEVARRRLGRLSGLDVLARLLEHVGAPGLEQRRRWTVANAAVLAGFNTHTTDAGDALVAAGASLADADGYAAMSLLDGARAIVDLGHFGIRTAIAEAPLVPLLEHTDWQVHGAAAELIAKLDPPRSEQATDVLVRLGLQLAGGSKATEIRTDQVIAALAAAAGARNDVDDALDAMRSHVSPAARVAATTVLARRRPERARALWEPWLAARSMNERTAAESMIATWGDERDVPEVVRIVEYRTKPPKGTSYWPPLAAEGLDFLVRHVHVPEAARALDRVRNRWDRHDDDLRRWLRQHHPDLVLAEHRDP